MATEVTVTIEDGGTTLIILAGNLVSPVTPVEKATAETNILPSESPEGPYDTHTLIHCLICMLTLPIKADECTGIIVT